jgi:hypothetical protein
MAESRGDAGWVSKASYDFTLFKGLRIAPDIQLYRRPAPASISDSEAVLRLRATATC